ncbi:hypothetical protein [Pseudorhodobacter aquimaris]|uniref:hypothetical protein n=1 Tax=Pseudorhodobacter aquimaris TaxID=687412 RepID=UPI00067B52AF|nr:hypothetical protein [Pseudorhodobacter aquimaris]
MLEDLKRFFEDYPRQILQLQGVKPAEVPDDLMDQLLDYRHRSLSNLEDAQPFRIDPDAFWMMSELINEMKRDGLDELFSQVRLPFSTMIVLPPVLGSDGLMRGNDGLALGVVTQIEDTIFTQRFIFRSSNVGPSNCVMISKGMGVTSVSTPTRDLFEAVGMNVPEGMIEDELTSNRTFLGIAVAIATLLRHDGMLKLEEVSLYPRQQRRQAERSGKVLPATLISKITLGKAGRGQMEAMKEDIVADERGIIARRTHWVRGHHMRSRSGKLVWRMPHLRGAGPLIKQLRHVTGATSAET